MNTIDDKEIESTDEKIEGLGDEVVSNWGEYPIDTVLIRTETRTAFNVVRRINDNRFVMNPDFQRDFIWSQLLQSRLIESVLMRLPLPVFYLAEDEDGKLVVVDGLQRLSTFKKFFNNELKLNLGEDSQLNGKYFKDLSAKLQNRVEDCNLTLYIIDAKVPERARLDIFERVNSGLPLTRQQMRNCLYMGAATKFLQEEAHSDIFLKATGKSLNSQKMRDREFINRFVSFQVLELDEYEDMDAFLAKGLKSFNNFDEDKIIKLRMQLKQSMENNFSLFGKHAFRRHSSGQANRTVINASLWDVMSTGLSTYSKEQIDAKKYVFKKRFYALLENDRFILSITSGSNAAKQVVHRHTTVAAMLKEVFE